MKNKRFRNFAVMTYHSEEVIKAVLCSNSSRIRYYAYILHDKDINADGTLKTPHYHLLLVFYNAMTENAVKSLFPSNQNTLTQVLKDKYACFNYLDHKDKPDKYQYDHALIVSNDLEYWDNLQECGEDDDNCMNIINDILAGVPQSVMVMRYRRDYIIHRDKYFAVARSIEHERKHIVPAKSLVSDDTFCSLCVDEEGCVESTSVMERR